MNKILDLSVFKEKTLDIMMLDGTTLHIKTPTQKMVIEVIKLRDINEESDEEDIMAALDDLTYKVLNSNKEGKAISKEDVAALEFPMKLAIVREYVNFLTEIQQDPNY